MADSSSWLNRSGQAIDRPRVHLLAMLPVELGGLGQPALGPQAFGADLGILGPECFVGREGIDHLGPLALPLRVLVAVEDAVGHVVGADHRAGHDAGDLLARAGQAQHGAGQDAFPRGALRELRADSSVCGSSSTTSDGRTEWPSARLYFMPRMRPVMPATLMIAPEALLPGIVGSTISRAVQPMCVRSPL